jgi:hypothetical protein
MVVSGTTPESISGPVTKIAGDNELLLIMVYRLQLMTVTNITLDARHRLEGWSPDKTKTSHPDYELNRSYMFSDTTTLYAVWLNIAQCKIIIQGNRLSSCDEFALSIIKITAPSQEDNKVYEFIMIKDSSYMIKDLLAGNYGISIVFTSINHKATFILDSVEISSIQMNSYDTIINLYVKLEKTNLGGFYSGTKLANSTSSGSGKINNEIVLNNLESQNLSYDKNNFVSTVSDMKIVSAEDEMFDYNYKARYNFIYLINLFKYILTNKFVRLF